MIQFPEVKSITPVLLSSQGAGKNTLIRMIQKMLGYKKVIEAPHPERDVWGNFNGLMKNAFLVNLDEMSKKVTNEAIGKIKSLQTEPTITINEKGKGQYDLPSYHHFIITSNDVEGGAIQTSEDDRRNLIIRCGDDLIGNKPYFEKLYSYLEDVNVLRFLYDHFKRIPDLKDFNSRPVPKTEYQKNLAKLSKCPISMWLEEFVTKTNENNICLSSADYYESFNNWKFANGFEDYKINSTQFMVRLVNKNIDGISKQPKKGRTGNSRQFDIIKIKNYLNFSEV